MIRVWGELEAEAEAVGLDDGMNVGLWLEREVGKAIWLEGRGRTVVGACYL